MVIPDPLDGEYLVRALGVGEGGEFRVSASYVTEEGVVEDSYVGTVSPNELNDSIVKLDQSQTIPISIGSIDEDPPAILINSPVSQDYLHSAMLDLAYEVIDADSGVASTTAILDGQSALDPVDLFFLSLGEHTFGLEAEDLVGNTSSSSVVFRVIATPESTVQDIKRAYALGWITNEQVKNTLAQMVKKAVKIVKRVSYIEETLPDGSKKRKKIEKLETAFDKLLGKKLLNELAKQLKRGTITQQAYDVLRADVEWLLEYI